MTPLHIEKKAPPCLLRRLVAMLTINSLLMAQQGVSFYTEAAGVVSGRAAASSARAPASGAAAAASGTVGIPRLSSLPLGLNAPKGTLASPPGPLAPAAGPRTAASTFRPALSIALPAPAPKAGAGAFPGRYWPVGVAAKHPQAPAGASSKAGAAGKDVAAMEGLSRLENQLEPGGVQEEVLSGAYDGLQLRIVEPGREVRAATLGELNEFLALDPGLTDRLNRSGKIRVILEKGAEDGISSKDLTAVRGRLAAGGITAQVQVESLMLSNAPQARETEPAKSGRFKRWIGGPIQRLLGRVESLGTGRGFLNRWLIRPLTWPLREAAFLVQIFIGSLTAPLWTEVLGGVATKSFPLAIGVGTWFAMIGPAHPFALGAAIAVMLALDTYHGIWLNSWNNFQNSLHRIRSGAYQTLFNFAYFQFWGVLFRYLSWTAKPDEVAPPWSAEYWRAISLASIVGTFFGTLGYQGLNALYEKGVIKRWHRSAIQQFRDVFFLLAGPLFATGAMQAFWILFAVQQSLDLALYLTSAFARRRTVLYLADSALVGRAEFRALYPAAAGEPEAPPLKKALQGLIDNPFVWPVVLPLRLARWIIHKMRSGRT